ncbi:MAG: hypothetical protein RSD39_07420, partial [Oscillospiraceae bacterium]
QDCGVNRRTFYYHFKDIYDLLEWILKTEINKEIKENITFEEWQQSFLKIAVPKSLESTSIISTRKIKLSSCDLPALQGANARVDLVYNFSGPWLPVLQLRPFSGKGRNRQMPE